MCPNVDIHVDTIDYKKIMVDFVDEVEESALRSNAINTVYRVKDKIIGANTDGIGFISSLKKDLSFNINSKTNVVCIGAGGAAYGVVSSLIDLSPNIISIKAAALVISCSLKNLRIGAQASTYRITECSR